MSILDQSASLGGSVIDPIAAKIKNPFSTTVPNNGERPQDFPGGFTISEYVDGTLDQTTIVRLVGNMLPFQPFEWEGKQRLVKEFYPGNPEMAVQVMGPEEGPLVVRGRFKDKRYRDPAYYGVAYQYNLAINEIRKRGNLLKFGLIGAAGNWIRWGFLERGHFKMNKQSWIDYEIEFVVVSENQPVNNYFSADEKQAPSAINQNLINQAASFQSNYSSVPKSMPLSIAGAINNLISGVAKNINLVTNFVNTVLTTAQDIENSGQRALGLIKNARSSLSKFNRQIDTIAHTFVNYSSQGAAAGQVKDTYRNLSFVHESISGSTQLSQYLAKMQAQFESIVLTVPKARYRVQSGDTLQNISIKFFGISDNWTKIFDHNKLSSTDLATATWTTKPILEIPNV